MDRGSSPLRMRENEPEQNILVLKVFGQRHFLAFQQVQEQDGVRRRTYSRRYSFSSLRKPIEGQYWLSATAKYRKPNFR